MKTKSLSRKLSNSYQLPSQTHLNSPLLNTFSTQTKKNSTIKIASTPRTLNSTTISLKNPSKTSKHHLKTPSQSIKSLKNPKNSKISHKKKLIKKDPLPTFKYFPDPRKTTSASQTNPKNQILSKGPENKKENRKNFFNKQNLETNTNQNVSQHEQTQLVEEKPIKTLDQTPIQLILDESIQIKMMVFERRQLQSKREDLLKRNVEDWDLINKGRSTYRELRNLGN